MADIIFRLPGKEQYSYVEVKTDDDEANRPDFVESVLQPALDALNEVYPDATGSTSGGGNSRPKADLPAFAHCDHGDMVYKEGGSGARQWKAYFCPQPKEARDKCKPVDAVSGKPWK